MAKDLRAELIKKALTDASFKSELLKTPTAAVEKAGGVKVPAGVTVKVLEDTASVIHLVLPAAPPKGSLSEKELASVAGGAGVAYTRKGYCDNTAPMFYCQG